MKYFTPELYLQFNSTDSDEANQADAAWDAADAAYKERLAGIRPYLPSQVVQLSELCLHDALVVSHEEQAQPVGDPASAGQPLVFSWTAVAIVSATLGDEVISLIYGLSDHVAVKAPPVDWRFFSHLEEWLYDEVDLLGERGGPFVHRILLSSGVVLEIPFLSVIIHKFTIPAARPARQSA